MGLYTKGHCYCGYLLQRRRSRNMSLSSLGRHTRPSKDGMATNLKKFMAMVCIILENTKPLSTTQASSSVHKKSSRPAKAKSDISFDLRASICASLPFLCILCCAIISSLPARWEVHLIFNNLTMRFFYSF